MKHARYDTTGNQIEQRRSGGPCTGGGTLERQASYDATHRPEWIIRHPTQAHPVAAQRTLFRYDLAGDRYLQRVQPNGDPLHAEHVTLYPFPGYEVEVRKHDIGTQVLAGRQMLGDYGLWTASRQNPSGRLIYRRAVRRPRAMTAARTWSAAASTPSAHRAKAAGRRDRTDNWAARSARAASPATNTWTRPAD